MNVTLERVSELMTYNGKTLVWKNTHRKRREGAEVGSISIDPTGTAYRRVNIDGKSYKCHRLVWLLVYGVWPRNQIDHIDGDGLNNCIENLRDVSNAENGRNQSCPRNNTSGGIGVHFDSKAQKWRAVIYVNLADP